MSEFIGWPSQAAAPSWLPTENVPTANLLARADNPRTHSKRQVEKIAASIRKYGFTNPILIDENNSILAGHGRLEAAKSLEMSSVPCRRQK
jgi:ParB-like chromosome segregation protein Spo0J